MDRFESNRKSGKKHRLTAAQVIAIMAAMLMIALVSSTVTLIYSLRVESNSNKIRDNNQDLQNGFCLVDAFLRQTSTNQENLSFHVQDPALKENLQNSSKSASKLSADLERTIAYCQLDTDHDGQVTAKPLPGQNP